MKGLFHLYIKKLKNTRRFYGIIYDWFKKEWRYEMYFKDITIIDDRFEAVPHSYVGTIGEKIAYVGTTEPEDKEKYGEVYDGRGKVLMPGFINSHAHSPMALMRGYGENLALDAWLNTRIFPFEAHLDSDAVYWGTMMSMAESIRYGITSSSDMYYFCSDIARAVVDSGAKANISRSIVHFEDRDVTKTDSYREAVDFFKEWHGAADGRILVDTSIHAEYTNNDGSVRALSELTKELGVNMHVHISETEAEHEQCKERHGGLTPVQYFDSFGMFDTRTTAAHCVWLEEEDYDILKRREATVAVNPISNVKLASGFCNVPKFFEKGINVAIGTDSVASNNSLNFIEEMKMFALLPKGAFRDPSVISPTQALRAGTINGAVGQGRMDTGIIKEGCRADLCVMDVDKPFLRPVHDMITNIIYSASGSDIVLTMCDGKVLYKDGEFLTIDIEKTIAGVENATARILSKL